MDQLITVSIQNGYYVRMQNADRIGISTIEKPTVIEFDSCACESVYGWTLEQCSNTVKGKIRLHTFPEGYMPVLNLNGVKYEYHHPYGENAAMKQLVIADSEDLYKAYTWYLHNKNNRPASPYRREVYKWDNDYRRWIKSGLYRDTSIDCVVGLEQTYRAILQDIDILHEKREMIEKLGMSPSVNILLESKPGMGKTSLIRALSTALNEHIHTITVSALTNTTPDAIFKQHCISTKINIYVFEDFDRYLNTAGQDQMASLLNALDGVENMPPSLRIFTSNTTIKGELMGAFLSRMRRKIVIDHHPLDAYHRSISIVFPEKDNHFRDTLSSIFIKKKLTMRQVNNVLCASIVYEDPISYISSCDTETFSLMPMVRNDIKKEDEPEDWYQE